MLRRQDVVEGAPYRLPDRGRVRVVWIDGGDSETLAYECLDDTLSGTALRPMGTMPVAAFRHRAEPLPVTVGLPQQSLDFQTPFR